MRPDLQSMEQVCYSERQELGISQAPQLEADGAEAYTWFAKLVAYGELIIGLALVIGAFTGIAAFLGAFMNWNYMMAGSASSNPMLFVVALGLISAWKVAGYIGVDYFLLPWIGTPWSEKADTELTNEADEMASSRE